jgi:dihydroorotate dehydrogenase electron transfer subunit
LGNRLLLVGGGYGAAPLLFLAQEGVAAGCRVDVCLGAKTAADVILTSAFTDIGSCVRVTTEDGSLGTRGLVTQAVVAAIRDDPPDAVYGCGPVGMLAAVERQCATYGLPYQLSWEARMRCGMGLCGACEVHGRSIDGWLVCRDGPVDRG